MASLLGRTPADSFKELLTINDSNGLGTGLQAVGDGVGGLSPLKLSLNKISLHGSTWPSSGAGAEKLLRMSANTNQLEWVSVDDLGVRIDMSTVVIDGGDAYSTGAVDTGGDTGGTGGTTGDTWTAGQTSFAFTGDAYTPITNFAF